MNVAGPGDPDRSAEIRRAAIRRAAIRWAAIRREAMNLLARREHSLHELRRKLGHRFGDGPAVEAALARLAEENLQSDSRFAESFVRQRAARGYGPARIRQELRERGLDEVVVATSLERADLDWTELAAEVLRKKFGASPPDDRRELAKRARFMQYRGFVHEYYGGLLED